MQTAISNYPSYLEQVKELVNYHQENPYDPLLLAIYYAPERNERDVFLFEVIDGFESGRLEESGDILEVLYGPTSSFPLHEKGAYLRILLTNPEELREAKARNTRLCQELKKAFEFKRAEVLYCHEGNEALLEGLR